MRNKKPIRNTRQVIHIVGEGLTELFYFKHLKMFINYRYSISPRLFENNSIEKIEKKMLSYYEKMYLLSTYLTPMSAVAPMPRIKN